MTDVFQGPQYIISLKTLQTLLSQVESAKNQHVVVILGEGDDEPLGRDLEAAAAAHLDVRALELSGELALATEDGHVKAVSVAVTHQDVACVAHVDAVGVVGDCVAANAAQELTVFVEGNHAMTLKQGWFMLADFFQSCCVCRQVLQFHQNLNRFLPFCS